MEDTASPPVHDEIMYRRCGIANYAGRGFLLGSAVGTAVHSVEGYRSTPAGGRLAGAACAALKKASRVGGLTGAYMAMFYFLEGVMARSHRRHDRWNSAAASAAALGLLNLPLGGPQATICALFGAACGGTVGYDFTTIRTGPPLGSISIDHKKKGGSVTESDEKLASLLSHMEIKSQPDMEHPSNDLLNMIAKDMAQPSEPSPDAEAGDQADEP